MDPRNLGVCAGRLFVSKTELADYVVGEDIEARDWPSAAQCRTARNFALSARDLRGVQFRFLVENLPFFTRARRQKTEEDACIPIGPASQP